MSQLYINTQQFNSGLSLNAEKPLDDRLQFGAITDLYQETSNPGNYPLYGKTYKGMAVSVVAANSEAREFILKNNTPYIYGSPQKVDANNFFTYWTEVGKGSADEISTTINPSINALETYAKQNNITVDGTSNGLTITPTDGTTGKTYKIKVNVDDSKVKFNGDNKITIGDYQLKSITVPSTETTVLTKFRLEYKAPNATEYTQVGDVIDIPKDFVLKEVHVCKAHKNNDGTYTETHKQGQAGYDEDTNPVCLHFIWNTKNETSTTNQTDSFIEVGDIISADIANVKADVLDISTNKIPTINTSIGKLNTSIADVSSNASTWVKNLKTYVDGSIGTINTHINSSISEVSTYAHTQMNNTIKSYVDGSIGIAKTYTDNAKKNLIDTSLKKIDTSIQSIYDQIGSISGGVIGQINTALVSVNASVNDISTHIRKTDTSINIINVSIGLLNDKDTQLQTYIENVSSNFETFKTSTNNELDNISERMNLCESSVNIATNHIDSSLEELLIAFDEVQRVTAASHAALDVSAVDHETRIYALEHNMSAPAPATRSAKSIAIDSEVSSQIDVTDIFNSNVDDELEISLSSLIKANLYTTTKTDKFVDVRFGDADPSVVIFYDCFNTTKKSWTKKYVVFSDDNDKKIIINMKN